MMEYRVHAEGILSSFAPVLVERGRRYAALGRVSDLQRDESSISATVRGTRRYDVLLRTTRNGRTDARCSCPAYDREGECKHLAALAWTLRGKGALTADGSTIVPFEPLPAVFATVYSTFPFFERLALYAGEPLVEQARLTKHDRWTELSEWWERARADASQTASVLRAQVIGCAPDVKHLVDALRTWAPPPLDEDGTAFSRFYEGLAEHYRECREDLEVHHLLPGPADRRHPGFAFSYDPKRRLFEAVETATPLLAKPARLAIEVPLDPSAPTRFEGTAFPLGGDVDAWELFALRAILSALHARTDAGVIALVGALARPIWDHVLTQLAPPANVDPPAREWMFCITRQWAGTTYGLVAFARTTRSSTGKTTSWKREPLEALLTEKASAKEQAIARIALCTVADRGPIFVLGTAQAHELLRLLADHPRVLLSKQSRGDPKSDVVTEIVAGVLSIRFERGEGGVLVPRFCAAGRPLPVPLTSLLACGRDAGRRATFLAAFADARGERAFVSVQVPPSLRPWLDVARTVGDALVFPPEAVPRLQEATHALVAAGIVELPRDALGVELAYAPAPAVRVEWIADGDDTTAQVEILIAVRPGAPLVEAGVGPRLFTFESSGERAFVERERAKEAPLVFEAASAIEALVIWQDNARGRTKGIEETLALAAWLEENPLGLTIEVKVGRPPTVAQFRPKHSGHLNVRKLEGWLVFDGALEVDGVKITIGEILEAARLAHRYVRAGRGIFLELSKEVIDTLAPVAVASKLGSGSPLLAGEPRAGGGSGNGPPSRGVRFAPRGSGGALRAGRSAGGRSRQLPAAVRGARSARLPPFTRARHAPRVPA